MSLSNSRPLLPAGVSFEIDELHSLQAWAAELGLRFALELDHLEGSREFEEFVSLNDDAQNRRLVSFWRARYAVMAVPAGGSMRRFMTLAQAIASLRLRNGCIEVIHPW